MHMGFSGISLSAADRAALSRIARAAFSNPFSREREAIDAEIAGTSVAGSRDELVDRALVGVSKLLARLDRHGRVSLDSFGGEDRRLLRFTLLFDAFHAFAADFDRLIERQLAAGDAPVPVPFARDVVGRLANRGFSPEESLRYVSVFFQLRRAFYFIHRGLVGNCPSMVALRARLWNNVFTHDAGFYDECLWNRMEDFSTLLLGETGCGKGAAAAAIGQSAFIPFDPARGRFAESFTKSFLSLNLCQYPDSLIESELFGHKKGAFTGAVSDYSGAFSRCSPHGCVFLDEIGDVAVPVQVKLLQVVQDRVFSPVGGHERERFSGRLIAATNRPLDELRKTGAFRDDFFYRISSDVVRLPTLRQRLAEDPAEFSVLVRHVVARIAGPGESDLAARVEKSLLDRPGLAHPWPGNVRELEQAVRRVVLVGRCDAPAPPTSGTAESALARDFLRGDLKADALLARYCASLFDRFGTYEEVARRAGLDRRTAKKLILRAAIPGSPPSA